MAHVVDDKHQEAKVEEIQLLEEQSHIIVGAVRPVKERGEVASQ